MSERGGDDANRGSRRSGRGSLRTQLIAYNVLAIALLVCLLGTVVHYTVTAAVLRSVDAQLDENSRHLLHGPPGGGGPGGGPGGPPPGMGGPMQGPPGFGPGGGGGPDMPPPPPGGFASGPQQDFQQQRPPGSGMDLFFPRGPRRRPPPADDGPYRPRRFDMAGEPLAADGRPGVDSDVKPWDASALRQSLADDEIRYSTVTQEDAPVRVLTRVMPDAPPYRGVLQIPYPLTDVDQALGDLDRALMLLAPVALIGAGLAGAALTDRVLRRVRRVADVAARIGERGTIAERLPVIGDDEFSALAETFNGMLGRLETAFARQENLIEQQRRFTADASHELKTPLTVIKGTASLALGAAHPTVDSCQQSLAEIDRAATVMSDLVQDLILLARSDAGQLGRNRIELLILEVLEQAKSRMPHREAGAGPQVRIQVQDPGLRVVGSEGDLIRLFANLLDNAIKYTPPEGQVLLTAQRLGGSVVVTVRDTGIGIAPQHVSRLGERFYRIDESRARSGSGGTGLGLSICKSIAAAHGGAISFASRPGAGTIVTVTLPAVLDPVELETA